MASAPLVLNFDPKTYLEFYSWPGKGFVDKATELAFMQNSTPVSRRTAGEIDRVRNLRWSEGLASCFLSYAPFSEGAFSFKIGGEVTLRVWFGTSLTDMNLAFEALNGVSESPEISIGNLAAGQEGFFAITWNQSNGSTWPECTFKLLENGADEVRLGSPAKGKIKRGELSWLQFLS